MVPGIITGLGTAVGLGYSVDSAGNLAEAVAILIEWRVVRMADKPVASNTGDGIGETRDAAAAAVNGQPLLPTDGKVAAEIQPGVGVDPSGTGGSARIYRR